MDLRHYTVYAYIAHEHAIGRGNWPVIFSPRFTNPTKDGKFSTTFAFCVEASRWSTDDPKAFIDDLLRCINSASYLQNFTLYEVALFLDSGQTVTAESHLHNGMLNFAVMTLQAETDDRMTVQ